MREITNPLLAVALAAMLTACATQHPATRGAPVSDSARTTTYVCEGGVRIVASYPNTESATIRYKGATYDLHIAMSADGARYVGNGLEWWTKGSGPGSHGTLFEHNADGGSGKRIEMCTAK